MVRVVRSDQQVLDTIAKMQTLIDGDFQTAINSLNQQGEFLANSGQWQGRYHDDFVPQWTQFYSNLQKMQSSLTELRQKIDQINKQIMISGGNM